MTTTDTNAALVGVHKAPGKAENTMIVRVAKEAGVSPFTQLIDVAKLSMSKAGMSSQEYYDMQLYRRDIPAADKKLFIGEKGSYRLNLKLAPPNVTHMRGFLTDKANFTALMGCHNIATTQTQAFFSDNRSFQAAPHLRNTHEIEEFLKTDAVYPLFGKPNSGSQAMGTISIVSCDKESGVVTLLDGTTTTAADVAKEISTKFGDGYLLQHALQQNKEVTEKVGAAVATIRFVTVCEAQTPRVLYAMWKVPGPRAMSDNFWQKGSILCHLDEKTGQVLTCRRGTGPDTEWLDTHPETGAQLKGTHVPNWEAAVMTVTQAHALFPVNGMLGWDVALTDGGAAIVECNVNSDHSLYQLAADKGVLTPEFSAVFEALYSKNAQLIEQSKQRNAARRKP